MIQNILVLYQYLKKKCLAADLEVQHQLDYPGSSCGGGGGMC